MIWYLERNGLRWRLRVGLWCSGVLRLRRRSNLGRGLGRGRKHETGDHPLAPGMSARSVGVFVLGDLDGLVQGVTEKCKGDCALRFDVAAGNVGEHAAEGGDEMRVTWNLASKQ